MSLLAFFNIPLLSVTIFLIFTLVIAVCSIRRRITFREYAVGAKQFSTATLVATVVACYGTGSLLRDCILQISDMRSGLYWIAWRLMGNLVGFLTLSWLVMRMSKFMYHISMAESIGRVYGRYLRAIVALFCIIYSAATVGLQIHAIFGVTKESIDGVHPYVITLLAISMLTVYCISGGIRSVILTDIWQCVTFSGLIVVLTWLLFQKTEKSFFSIITFLQTKEAFSFNQIFPLDQKLVSSLRYLSSVFNYIDPVFIQVAYMSSSPRQAKKVFLYSNVFVFILTACILLAGIFAFVWASDIPNGTIWPYIMANASPFFKGLVCVSFLAMAMSTIDSRIHICAVMVSHDIRESLFSKKSPCYIHEHHLLKVTIFAIATLGVILACRNDEFKVVAKMNVWCNRLYMPVVVAPFTLAVLGFRGKPSTAFIGMAVGGLAFFISQKWIAGIVGSTSSSFPCMLLNGLTILAVHYLLPWSKSICSRLWQKQIKKLFICLLCSTKFFF